MSLALKVLIETTGQTKKMKFNADASVSETLQLIREKTESGGPDFGLFQPASIKEPTAKWLKENRTLAAYNLETDDEIHFRKKHSAIKVKLLDGTVKVMIFDLTLTVNDIVTLIGEKIDLAKSEEYSLQWENPQPNNAPPRLDWLVPTKPIEEQGLKIDLVFLLKKKYFYSDANISLQDPMGLHLLFVQATDAIISGLHPIVAAEACSLAALQAQVLEGR